MTMATLTHPFKTIIGLEVHVQLKTRTKLFCRCYNRFGGEPNTQVCAVCLGLPGTLPVINRAAVDLAIRAGLALGCSIPPLTKWDRKQYFYPDLPKGYQISQFDLPICSSGHLDIADPTDPDRQKRIRITRAHLEEDAGKSIHDESAGKTESRIDLNRCGTPLLEIVSEPDLRSAAEAKSYLTELKLLMTHLGISDCEMQEGSLRVDANVNLWIDSASGQIATPIVEIKNMNSFRSVERAINYEAERQYVAWQETGRTIKDEPKTTRGWDDVREHTFIQREKEESADYRYFPDPDLPPVRIPREHVESIREALGELPAACRKRLESEYQIKPYDADVIVNQGPSMIAYFESVAIASGDGRRASNWIQQDVMRALKERDETIEGFPLPAIALGGLLRRVTSGNLDNARAREAFAKAIQTGQSIDDVVDSMEVRAVDASAIDDLCRQILNANPQVFEDFKAGKVQAIGALIGQAKKINPNANPQSVRESLLKLLNSQ